MASFFIILELFFINLQKNHSSTMKNTFNPFQAAESLFILTGATCMIYGIAGFINWLKFRQ
jgi:hypothetical protein